MANKTTQILKDLQLNWEVNKFPLSVNFVDEQGHEHIYDSGGHFGVVRMDNKEILAACKGSYTPCQNHETIEILNHLAQERQMEIKHGGPINGGRRLYVQMEMETGMEINGDKIAKYLFAINSHDGTTSLAFGSSNMVFSCQNKFFRFYKDAQFRVRHTSAYQYRINEALAFVDSHRLEDQKVYENYLAMSKKKASLDTVRELILELEGVDLKLPEASLKELHSTRKINKAMDMFETVETEMKSKGKTMWGLFNGITFYTNHKTSAPQRDNGREEHLLMSTGYNLNNRTYDLIVEGL